MNLRRRDFIGQAAALAAASGPLAVSATTGSGSRTLFVRSAVEHDDITATLPLYRGTSQGRSVWYVLLDASDGNAADRLGVNRSSKLEVARGSTALQKVGLTAGVVDFPASVRFDRQRIVAAGPTGFPPAAAVHGPEGEPGYSPLIQLPDGSILNAPQVANASGLHPKVVSIDFESGRVRLRQSLGYANGHLVRYISTDASASDVAALENATFARALNAAPTVGGDGTDSARTSLAAFVNGQTGLGNPQRQGLNSALLDGADPLNLLFWEPNQGRYSPLWDVFPAAWSDAAVAAGRNLAQKSRSDLLGLVADGLVTGPGGARFAAAGFVVNCPIVSAD